MTRPPTEPDPEWDALQTKLTAIGKADPVVQAELYRWFTEAQNLGLINAALENEVAITRVLVLDQVAARVREMNGNGRDEPSEPALEAVLRAIASLRKPVTP